MTLPSTAGRAANTAVSRTLAELARIVTRTRAVAVGSMLAMGLIAAPVAAHVIDDFTRPAGPDLGNDWVEKSPAAFSLVNNEAVKQSVSTWYRDNVVYRPTVESSLDTEATLEFRVLSIPVDYPQLLVRLQASTVGVPDTLDGYMLYFPDSTSTAVLGRQTSNTFVTTLASIGLSQPLNTTDRFRMRLRAVGTNPVNLNAYIERLNGAVWQVIGQAAYADAAATRIATTGTTGFGGYVGNAYAFDNFTRIDLNAVGTTNAAPTAAALNPSSVDAGSGATTVTVYGSGFSTDSVVRWNGANRATTFVSPSELQAQITAADLASVATRPITIFNPAPGGGVSAALTFQVTNPATPPPAIANLSPASAYVGSAAFDLTINGTGFDGSSVVRWNGAARTTTYVSATQLRAAIAAGDIAALGTANVSVLRVSDNSASGSQPFAINSPPVSANFTDTFDRPNGPDLNNGWIEKVPGAFSIVSGQAAKQAVSSGYRDNLVYRAAAEDILDVEVSAQLTFSTVAPGYPQLVARGQSTTIGNPDRFDAYMVYVDGSTTRAILGRQQGDSFVSPLATLNLSPGLNTTDQFRLRLAVSGTNPVTVYGAVERWNGTTWQIIGQATVSDSSASRISTAGSVGLSGHVESGYTFDNFARSPISGGLNPAPTVTSVTPSSIVAGSSGPTLTVSGTNFVAGSAGQWNGASRATTFVSSTQVQIQLNAADVASAGSAAVTVLNPPPAGGSSAALVVTVTAPVTNPVPVATTLNPSSVLVGSGAFTLTVTGNGFVNGSVVRLNGSNRATTFVSSGELNAAITAADVSTAGSRTVTVFSPTPGGGTSGNLTLQVASTNPVPTLSSTSPASIVAGSPDFTLTATGSNFVNGSTIRWNGSNRTTTFISAAELRAAISAADVTTAGNASITVFSPTPGGGTSVARTFTVSPAGSTNPVPVLTQISPNQAQPGSAPVLVTVTGSGFNATSVVRWNGGNRPTTLVSGTELRGEISAADLSSAGVNAIAVFNPVPGGGTSAAASFFVQEASLTLFTDNFNRANSETVGNSWTEKNPTAFYLNNNVVTSRDTSSGFPQDIMFRPVAEDRLDVETSVEFVRLANDPNQLMEANFPQLHARVQRNEVLTAYSINSYIFFIEDVATPPGRAIFAINRAPPLASELNECYIAGLPLPTALVEGQRYRLRFRVTGTSPVLLTGFVDRYNAGTWELMTSGTAIHDASTQRVPGMFCEQSYMPPPITTAGATGIAKWANRTDLYDNFYWRETQLAGPTAPTISLLSPTSVAVGSGAFQMTVFGSSFSPTSIVRWNGANRTTTYISASEVRASISAADVSTAGSALITVTNSVGTSSPTAFQIVPPAGTETLFDSFARADGATIGNGWIEKFANAFSIVSGRAQKNATAGSGYINNLVYRPASEDILNVEASAEFRLLSSNVGYPEIIVRAQADTIATAGSYDGYLMYLADSTTQVVVSRQNGSSWDTPLVSFGLSSPINTTDTYRLRLRAVGTSPVALQGTVERLNGSAWQIIGQASINDTAPERITTPGSVAFGGDVESGYAFDNFRRVVLGD